MTNERALVTGAGGGIGQSILKAMHLASFETIAADCDPLAAGLYGASRAYLVPRATCANFIRRIIEICRREECRLVFCGIEPELPVFARAVKELRENGIIAVVSSPEVIELADDKLATAEFLRTHGHEAPVTLSLCDYDSAQLPLPVILKPRKGGARSQGVYLVTTEEELRFRRATLDGGNYIAQELVPGDEFTCGTITFEGHCHGVITMRRTLRDGDTYKAFVVDEACIREHVRQVAEELRPFGPCNFQLRMKNGRPCIFEINARCSGTTACRALAGFNEPLMCAEFLLHNKIPQFQIKPLSFLRYWNELPIANDRIEKLKHIGELAGDGTFL